MEDVAMTSDIGTKSVSASGAVKSATRVKPRKNVLTRWLSAAVLAGGLFAGAASVAMAEPVERSGDTYHVAVCKRLVPDTEARCLAHVVTDSKGHILWQPAGGRVVPKGFGPADLTSAYNITTQGASSTIIAIVDAFAYPRAEADLGVYRAQYGLPPCTTANGCFAKYNQQGANDAFPATTLLGWQQETALDLDMASAMCPNCKITLVEADSAYVKNFAAAEDTAAAKGAHVISNSYTASQRRGAEVESSYDHPGVAITAATGDDGFAGGPGFPAGSPHVTAVGGTSLSRDSNVARGWSETAWSGAGSGCARFFKKPKWQTDTGCKHRMTADVSAVADPATGVAVYGPVSEHARGWLVYGGTSVATPIIGGIYGNNGGKVMYGSNPYAHTDALYDVTTGGNGACSGKPGYYCNAGAGYDGPTGLGTPNGNTAF
jgi:subtilase family serine protease